MPIDSISGISPVFAAPYAASAAAPMTTISRPPETTPDARESAAQENDARRTSEAVQGAAPSTLAGPDQATSSVGTRQNVVPASNDSQLSLERASAEISRAYQGGEPTASQMRAASEAYRSEAAAQDQVALQQQQGGRSADVMV